MVLSSMTGFARSHGASGPYAFEWELKSVNAKGFDLRMRLPPGWDELESFAKKRASEVLSRGTVYANLSVKRANAASTVRINEDVLASIVRVAGELASRIDAVAPSIDGLLAIKGVIEVVEPESDEAEDKAAKAAAAASRYFASLVAWNSSGSVQPMPAVPWAKPVKFRVVAIAEHRHELPS